MLIRKLYGFIMGKEVVCILQKGRSFVQGRRPGPLVRSALGIYRDIQFQKETLVEQALDSSLRDVHASLCPTCFGPRESTDLPHTAKDVYMAVMPTSPIQG